MAVAPEELLMLARRLEAIPVGGRLLDAALHAVAPLWSGGNNRERNDRADDDRADDAVPRYTLSLDAAAGLVPPWALWSVRSLWSGQDYERTAFVATVTAYRFPEQSIRFSRDGQGRTAALALCAAALKVLAGSK